MIPHRTRHFISAIGTVVLLALLSSATTTLARTPDGVKLLEAIEDVFVQVAEEVQNGVVSVTPVLPPITMTAPPLPPGGHRQMPQGQLPPGHPSPGQPNAPGLPNHPPMDGPGDDGPGNGTGLLLDRNGNVVTNAHVVGNATEMRIRLRDGRRFVAQVVGKDPETDIAVLKIDSQDPAKLNLPVLPLGDSDKVRPGQWALAVGDPFGLDRTVTVGIVSAVGREGVNLTRYENFIQTDASINPGNSGGPLFNIHGEVIGITTAIMSYAQGIGFAIPVNMMRQVVDQLIASGHVDRGWLGIGIQEVGEELAASFGVDEGSGVLINEVFADQPAAMSGLRPGDIILSVNGTPVASPNTLARVIATLPPDSDANMVYLRDGKRRKVKTTLARRDPGSSRSAAPTAAVPPLASLGLDLQELTAELAEKLEVSPGGLIVAQVNPNGLAARKSIRPGDVIREVNRSPITSLDELNSAIAQADDGKLLLRITRQEMGRYVVLPLSP